MALLCIVEDDLSLGVDDLCERAGFAERAAVREGTVGLRHLAHGDAARELAEAERSKGDIRIGVVADLQLVHEGRKAELLRQELVAVLHAEVIEDLDGDGVERTRQTAQHIAKAAVGSGVVLRPVAVFVQRRVLVDRRGRNDPGVQRGRIDCHRLE